MRIISKFHDYYDSVLKQGADTSIVYVRESIKEIVSKYDEPKYPYIYNMSSYRYNRNPNWSISLLYLGFCGKIYPIVKFSHSLNSQINLGSELPPHFCYSMDEVLEFTNRHVITLHKDKEWRWRGDRRFDPDSEKSLIRFFIQTEFDELSNVFAKKNVPIFSYQLISGTNGERTLELNCSLKELQFFRQKDAFTCFQDISMFVSGVLNSKENEMVKISDKDKVHKHGFDKWSFRTKGPNSKD